MHSVDDLRALVHKYDDQNTWIRAARLTHGDAVEFEFEIPAGVRPRMAEYIEVQRQATHAFAHLHLGVPASALAMLETADLTRADVPHPDAPLPSRGLAVVRSRHSAPPRGGVFDIFVGVEFADERGSIATGSITGRYLPPRLYERFRAASPGSGGADPARADDVAPISMPLIIDRTNPILNDHDSDHVSGMAVICAAEQIIAEHLPERALAHLTTRFLAFIEPSLPATLELQVAGDTAVATVVQADRWCARSAGVTVARENGGPRAPRR